MQSKGLKIPITYDPLKSAYLVPMEHTPPLLKGHVHVYMGIVVEIADLIPHRLNPQEPESFARELPITD